MRFADPISYDLWYETKGKEIFLKELSVLKKVIKGFDKGLEVGVGTGRFASSLGVEFGLDPDENMVRFASKRGILGVVGIGEALPFKSSSFDLILLVFTLCFAEKPPLIIKECNRCLKSGGELVIGFIPRESSKAGEYIDLAKKGHPIYSKARFYGVDEVSKLVVDGGFRIEARKGIFLGKEKGPYPDFLVWKCAKNS